MKKTYKALIVKNATHLKIAVAAKQAGLTIDAYLNAILKEPLAPDSLLFKPKNNK